MSFKVIGMLCIVAGCGGCGFLMASQHRLRIRLMKNMIDALAYMECELQYRLTPLPELCRQAASTCTDSPSAVFTELALEMESQINPDVDRCMAAALEKTKNIPPITRNKLIQLGKSIGRFDLNGQLKGLEAIRQECRRNLESLCDNQDNRLRSYQTLGLCAGAALVILFI